MVTLTETKIILEIEDKAPKALLNEIKISIIDLLQNVDFQTPNLENLETSHYLILKILKELLNENQTQVA